MGVMKAAATRGLIPAGNKVSELRDNLTRLMTQMALVLEERFGQEGLDAIAEIFHNLGTEDAKNMKERLGLGDTLSDAVDAWKIVGHVMGAKMEARKVSPDRVETVHPFCPQYEAFKDAGKLYCESVCLPYVRAVGEGIGDGVTMEVVRPADTDSTCIKALVFTRGQDD